MNNEKKQHHAKGDVWDELNSLRMDLAEMKGMLKMHFKDGVHHAPPCTQAKDIQKTMYSTILAALLALVAAFVNIVISAHGG